MDESSEYDVSIFEKAYQESILVSPQSDLISTSSNNSSEPEDSTESSCNAIETNVIQFVRTFM